MEIAEKRKLARELVAVANHAAACAKHALENAPYTLAKRALDAVDGVGDEIAARLGVGPIMGVCESCEEYVFGDESYSHSDDGVRICEECTDRWNAEDVNENAVRVAKQATGED